MNAVIAFLMCCSTCGWTLHGLWPEDGNWCNPSNITMNMLQPLQPKLSHEWISCEAPNDPLEFYQHEWSKHGSCTGWTPLVYFNTSLSYYNRYLKEAEEKCTPMTSCKLNTTIDPDLFVSVSHFDLCPFQI